MYEGVPIESIKLSDEYNLAFDQNTSLKQLMNSLLSYHLLKDKGDELLKSNTNELEQELNKYFIYV